MGEMITKPDANPIIFAVCNLFFFGALGYFLMGQQKKAIVSAVVLLVGWPLISIVTCFIASPLGTVWGIIVAYDAYLLGQKLQSGESIGMNENGLDFLNSIFKD